MWTISNLLALLVTFSAIDQISSAVHFNTRPKERRLLEYTMLKLASTYRGLFFTLSVSEKNQLCQEVFSVQLYAAGELENDTLWSLINDGLNTDGEPQYPLIVKNVKNSDSIYAERTEFPFKTDTVELFIRCVGKSFVQREPYSDYTDLHLSSAFRSGWFYANTLVLDRKDGSTYVKQLNFFMKSPQYVQLEAKQLEEQYVNSRRIMRELAEESPKYVEMIEGRNDLLPLSKFKRDLLCASVLSAPIYRKDRLEFSLDRYEKDEATLDYANRELKFINDIYNKENFKAYCFICHAYADQDDEKKGPENLFLTPAFDANHSLYVLKEEPTGIFLGKYFTHVPLLKNADVYTPEGSIHKNYSNFKK